jgi:uncharacterized protein (DUF58 family)
LRLVATDPLGLFRRVRTHGDTLTLYVQPKTVSLAALPSGQTPSPDGPRADRAADGTVTFHSLRQYEFGDDLRHIHWRTSARTGTLMVRQLVDTSLPRTLVLLDNRASAYRDEDDFELAVDVAASAALGAASLGFPVSVVCGNQEVSTMDGERTPPAVLLDRLSLVGTRTTRELSMTVAARSRRGRGAMTFVTGGHSGSDLASIATRVGEYDRVVVVRVGDDPGPVPAGLPITVVDAPDLTTFALAWRRRAA